MTLLACYSSHHQAGKIAHLLLNEGKMAATHASQDGSSMGQFFGTRDFPQLKVRIRDLKAKQARVSGLKVCLGGGIPEITLGITGLHEILGQGNGIEEPYWGPSISNRQWAPANTTNSVPSFLLTGAYISLIPNLSRIYHIVVAN